MTPLDCLSPITTMIFLSLMPARQGVDNWSAMRSSRASFSIRSDSSGWPNLKPSARAGPVAREASATSIANARLNRTEVWIKGIRSHGAKNALEGWKVSPMRPGNPYGIFDTPPPGAAVATCGGQDHKAVRAGPGVRPGICGSLRRELVHWSHNMRNQYLPVFTSTSLHSVITTRPDMSVSGLLATLDPSSLASYGAVFTVFFGFLVEGDTVLATSLVAPEPVLDAVFVALRTARFGALRVAVGG